MLALLLLAAIAGVVLPVQAGINAQLRVTLAQQRTGRCHVTLDRLLA